ncbi:hypothetical protein ACMHYJ_16815, partial [Castellaniella hirudinis]|uniref:hypothetical protein n=1 Tax=Castellaniella hirudinis TaxID=1144617 RepID=UPI0039C4882B
LTSTLHRLRAVFFGCSPYKSMVFILDKVHLYWQFEFLMYWHIISFVLEFSHVHQNHPLWRQALRPTG